MSDAQTWTLIGGFLAITLAMNAIQIRVLRAEAGRIFEQIRVEVAELRGEIQTGLARIDATLSGINERVTRLEES